MKSELSSANPYYIPKQRYYELKHFCLQYSDWRKELAVLDGYLRGSALAISSRRHNESRPTEEIALERMRTSDRMEMVRSSVDASVSGPAMRKALLMGVTEGVSYEILCARIPEFLEPRDVYYAGYRRFFWNLDRARK